jgi:PAS domain S-box-containing protein
MQNLDSYKPRSISRTLSVGLIITLVLVAGLSLGVNFILSSRKAKAELEARAEEYISALTDALKVPLWNYSEETIAAICASYAQNEFVAKLRVEDQKGAVFFEKEKVDQRLVVSRSRDISYEGNLIGRVHIALASGYYTAVNRQLFQSFGLTIVIMIGTLLVMTSVLLRQFLKKPMSRFIKMVHAYAAGESDAFKHGTPYSEFGPLVDVLDEMGEKIASQMKSIRKLNEDLEKRVAERTAELRKLSEAIEQSPVTVMITDKKGTIEYVNPSFSEVTGYSAKEAIGQNPGILKSGNHPNTFYKELWETILSGRTWRGQILNRKKNDEEFWESTSISAIKNDQDEITHFVAVKQDITERKKAEEEIKNSQQRLAQIIDFLPDPTWVVDNEGKVVRWNKAIEKLLNVKAENMVGKGNYEHALPFYGERRPVLIDLVRNWQPEYEEKYLSVKKEGKNLISESYHEHLGDGGIYLSATAGLLYDAAGKIAGAIESLRDTTEHKHMETDLRRNLEELERFNKLAIGREIMMIKLKEEINGLLCQLNQDKRYKIVK